MEEDDLSVIPDHPVADRFAAGVYRALRATLAGEGTTVGSLAVVLSGHETVRELNIAYLEHDYDTDVLAFDLRDRDSDPVDGEIYVDVDTAIDYSEETGENLEREVCRYAVHGLLHLLGHRDDTPEGKAAMRALEDRYI